MKLIIMQIYRGEDKKHLIEFQIPIRLEKTNSHDPAVKSIISKAFTAICSTLLFLLFDKLSTNRIAM
ncbi:hypothetical protein ACJIZ3_020994 [Penstemon smallii]|uniref:Uncharacterized protein n=1 Tax=Penstemon smallii TaxID=265156 RepID=A0ABD3SKS6_9LAMI